MRLFVFVEKTKLMGSTQLKRQITSPEWKLSDDGHKMT